MVTSSVVRDSADSSATIIEPRDGSIEFLDSTRAARDAGRGGDQVSAADVLAVLGQHLAQHGGSRRAIAAIEKFHDDQARIPRA